MDAPADTAMACTRVVLVLIMFSCLCPG